MKEIKDNQEEINNLALIVKNSPELINIATPDGRMTFLNDAGQEMLGIPQDEIENYSVIDVISNDFQEKVMKELFPILREKGSWEGNLQYRNVKTNKIVDVYAKCFAVKDEKSGNVKFYTNISTNTKK